MDSDKEYVEVFDDEGGARDKRGRPAQLRRYKDDAYRSATHTHTHRHTHLHSALLPSTCTAPEQCHLMFLCHMLQSMLSCRSIQARFANGSSDILSKTWFLSETFHNAYRKQPYAPLYFVHIPSSSRQLHRCIHAVMCVSICLHRTSVLQQPEQ